MIASEIGIATIAAHLRLVENPSRIERSAPACDRASLRLIVNDEFGKPQFAKARSWLEELVDDLARRTCAGTIAKGTYRYIYFYPSASVLQAAHEVLAKQGIRMEINPLVNDDGSISVWMEYTRLPASNG